MAMRYAYQVGGFKGETLLKMFSEYSKAVIYKHCKKPLQGELKVDKRIGSGIGRPAKLTHVDHRNIRIAIPKLRETDGSFTSRRVQVDTGLEHVSNRTVRRAMNKNEFHYLYTRKKGVLSPDDIKNRLRYARDIVKNKIGQEFWSYGVSFYLDGKGFAYKTNPMDQAYAPRAKEWRRPNEGLTYGCTAKGKKEGSVQARFMIAISFQRGVVLCEQYDEISGEKFAKMMDSCLPQAFQLSINPYDRLFVQDGDPSQNSAVAKEIIENIGAQVVEIPARSPDLNPIENFFGLLEKALRDDAKKKNIRKETFQEFSARIRNIVVNYDNTVISNLIGSMDRRIKAVIKAKGQRTKY